MPFHRFYETWLAQLRQLIHQLRLALQPYSAAAAGESSSSSDELQELVEKVMAHYDDYHRAKAAAAHEDVLELFVAPWTSSLERSLHWVAGWRPTTVFHLVYTESSIQFESHIMEILRGHRTGDLGDLSPAQLSRVSELQCQTVTEENGITGELSDWQDNASDLLTPGTDLDLKIERLASIVERADDLRLRTIRGVVELLSPQQAGEFLISASELQFGVHEWGMHQDRRRGNS